MSARVLDGAALAKTIRAELRPAVEVFTEEVGRPPALHLVLAGDDPASAIYVRNKERAGVEAGLTVQVHRLRSTATIDAVLALLDRLNRQEAVDGILVQSPLPAAMGETAEQQVFDALDPAKDVDGFHPHNVGLLVQGRAGLGPCTPSGIVALLEREGVVVAGRHAVIIGRSDIVGKPLAFLLLQRHATVTICHSRTVDLPGVASRADILVSAVGRPGFVTAAFVKPGAVVIDVGINRLDNREQVIDLLGPSSARLAVFDKRGSVIVGDVHPEVAEVAGALTPVPGGVGPLTIAMLLGNTLTAARARAAGRTKKA